MRVPEASVAIVVDPEFGAKLQSAAASGPVWIAQTKLNKLEAERLWASGIKNLTTFVVREPFDPEGEVVNILRQVLLHHPNVQEVRVIGCSPSNRSREEFGEAGYEISARSDGGFIARPSAAA